MYGKAIKNYEKGIKLNPEDTDFYYGLGYSKYKLGSYEEALANFEKALELGPAGELTALMYFFIELRLGDALHSFLEELWSETVDLNIKR